MYGRDWRGRGLGVKMPNGLGKRGSLWPVFGPPQKKCPCVGREERSVKCNGESQKKWHKSVGEEEEEAVSDRWLWFSEWPTNLTSKTHHFGHS